MDRKRVVSFCEALLDRREAIQWGCSARTDCIDDELIDLMYRAGCRSLFFGIETGSPRMQRAIEKDLDLGQAAARINACTAAGINTTVSLITGFPEETEEDMWQTISFLMDSTRHELVEPQLHLIAPLAGTPLHYRFRDQLVLDDICSDISYQGWDQDAQDRHLIASYPNIFSSFYGIPAPNLDRARLKRLRGFVLHALGPFRWVAIAIHQSRGGIGNFFEEWEKAFPSPAKSTQAWTRYYSSAEFGQDLADFVRKKFRNGTKSDLSLETLLKFSEGMSAELRQDNPPQPTQCRRRESLSADEIIPVVQAEVRLLDLDADINRIFRRLRRGEGLPSPCMRRLTIASRGGKSSGTDILELTSLSASFLRLCDGRTLDQVAEDLEFDKDLVDGIGKAKIAEVLFDELCRQRLVSWRYAGSS